MKNDFKKRASNVFWSYRWSFGGERSVLFSNPRVSANIIYTESELRDVLLRSDAENMFIPIPRKIMQEAISLLSGADKIAA